MSNNFPPSHSQDRWWALVKRTGSEEAARKELARQLRAAADQVEAGAWPDVYGCTVFHDDGEMPCENSFIDTVSVTLSHPWPG